jgi:nitrogen fixation NifU-like protein
MAKGKTLVEAKGITNKDVAAALEGLPKNKLHCSNLGADALHMAIKDYEDRKEGKQKQEPKRKEDHLPMHGGGSCYCPYCETEIDEGAKECEFCHSDLAEAH